MIYFIYGDSSPLQIKSNELIQSLKNEDPDMIESTYDGVMTEDEDNFWESLSSSSMFATSELLIYKRVEKMKGLEKLISTVFKYDITGKTIVFIYEEMLNDYDKPINTPSQKLLKECEEHSTICKVHCFRKESQERDIYTYVQQNLSISQGEAKELIDAIGTDYYKVQNEIEKVKNYLDGERYEFAKVKPILSISKEYNIRNLIDDFLIKNETQELLTYLGESHEYMGFIYMLADELTWHLKLCAILEYSSVRKGMSFNTFKDTCFDSIKDIFITNRGTYPHPYSIYVRLGNLGKFQADFVQRKIHELLEVEYGIKSGNIDESIAVEKYILGFSK